MSISSVGQQSPVTQRSDTTVNVDYDGAIQKTESDLAKAKMKLVMAEHEKAMTLSIYMNSIGTPNEPLAEVAYRQAEARLDAARDQFADLKSKLDQLIAARDSGGAISVEGTSPSSGADGAPGAEAVAANNILMLKSAIQDKTDAVKQREARIEELSNSPMAMANQPEIERLKAANRTDLAALQALTALYQGATSKLPGA